VGIQRGGKKTLTWYEADHDLPHYTTTCEYDNFGDAVAYTVKCAGKAELELKKEQLEALKATSNVW